MDAVIALYTPQLTPRFKWAAKVFFKNAMRLELVIYTSEEAFAKAEGIKVNYSPEMRKDTFNISPHGLLWEHEISDQEFYTSDWEGMPIFCQRQIGDLPFDPLAAAFYLVSRYEEYLPFIPDEHGRFPAKESFAFINGFLERPLVGEWALAVGRLLLGAEFELAQRYNYLTTVDIDNLFAYKGKGALRTIGACAKDLRSGSFGKLKERLSTLFNLRRDPYDTFRKQRNWNKTHGIEAIYFMLFAPFGPKDRNVSSHSTEAAVKLREIADWSTVGIHPSYASNSEADLVQNERVQLQEVLRRPVIHSRQHYLRMRTPQTFRNLVDLGVKEEHSMGYTYTPGFRSSMASSYTFYDLEMEAELPLVMRPFAFMDITYAHLSPEAAAVQMKQWIPAVKKVGGTLISVWHNRTFSEHEAQWKNWPETYKTFIHAAQP
jgi:hypothetical protein